MDPNITLLEYCWQHFFPSLQDAERSKSWKRTYKTLILQSHPELLNRPIRLITRTDIRYNWIWLQQNKRRSRKAANRTEDALRACFKRASADGIPCADLCQRQRHPQLEVEEPPAVTYTRSELQRLELAIPWYFMPDFYMACLHCSVPHNILLALTIEDIPANRGDNFLTIHQKAVSQADRYAIEPITPFRQSIGFRAMASLRQARDAQNRERFRRRSGYNPNHFIFADEKGTLPSPSQITFYTALLREATGVLQFSIRDMQQFNRRGGLEQGTGRPHE